MNINLRVSTCGRRRLSGGSFKGLLPTPLLPSYSLTSRGRATQRAGNTASLLFSNFFILASTLVLFQLTPLWDKLMFSRKQRGIVLEYMWWERTTLTAR